MDFKENFYDFCLKKFYVCWILFYQIFFLNLLFSIFKMFDFGSFTNKFKSLKNF